MTLIDCPATRLKLPNPLASNHHPRHPISAVGAATVDRLDRCIPGGFAQRYNHESTATWTLSGEIAGYVFQSWQVTSSGIQPNSVALALLGLMRQGGMIETNRLKRIVRRVTNSSNAGKQAKFNYQIDRIASQKTHLRDF